MNLIFKNPTIKTDYEFFGKLEGKSVEERSRICRKNNVTEERMALSILIGYLSSLCKIAEECENIYESRPTLDLTYATVEHLPFILGQQYFSYVKSGSYTSEKALEIANKTLASYFMLLCMNEHMCFPVVQRLNDFDFILNELGKNNDETPKSSWMGCTIKTGVNSEYDILQELGQIVRITVSGTFRIRFNRLVALYRQMCGVDLREMGLDDFEGGVK